LNYYKDSVWILNSTNLFSIFWYPAVQHGNSDLLTV
jgi:hypothetical protein